MMLITSEDDATAILRRLMRLYQEDKIENMDRVDIFIEEDDEDLQIPFTENMVSDIIRSFRHISSKGIMWDKLSVSGFYQDDPQSLVSQILKIGLFREIELDFGKTVELNEQTARDISDAMENTKIEKLNILGVRISPIVSSVLWEGLAESQNLTELLLFVEFAEASSDQPSAADAVSYLVTGLQNNKTLKRLSIPGMSDQGCSRIITALEGHPTLENLEFSLMDQVDKTLKSLRGLLSLQTCKACSLGLSGQVDLDLLLEGLEQNESLIKQLSLIACDLDDGDLSKLLRNLWKLQNLTRLDLSGNVISKFPVLDASDYVKVRQSRLRSLDLDDNPIMEESKEEDQSALLRLVISAPQLGYVACPHTTEHSDPFLLSSIFLTFCGC
jgi:hypothetical protein